MSRRIKKIILVFPKEPKKLYMDSFPEIDYFGKKKIKYKPNPFNMKMSLYKNPIFDQPEPDPPNRNKIDFSLEIYITIIVTAALFFMFILHSVWLPILLS